MRLECCELHTPIHQLSLVGFILYQHVDKKKKMKHIIDIFCDTVSLQNNCEKESRIWMVSLKLMAATSTDPQWIITPDWPLLNVFNNQQLSKFGFVTFYQVFYFNPIKPISVYFARLDSHCYYQENNLLSVI